MYCIGVDLGQAHDATAVVVTRTSEGTGGRIRYTVVGVERAPRNVPYTAIKDYLISLRETEGLERAPMVVDATGVGRPVIDMLRQAHTMPTPVTCTGGESTGKAKHKAETGYYSVTKIDLVTTLHQVMEMENLHIPEDLPLANELRDELSTFELRTTAAGNLSFGATGSAHDDLVFALMLAVFWSQRTMPYTSGGERYRSVERRRTADWPDSRKVCRTHSCAKSQRMRELDRQLKKAWW